MRISTAYFAGVGTVIVAVTAGLGGGYLAANITSPPLQTVSKLERRMSAEPIAVSTAPAEPVPRAAATNTASAPPQEQPQQQPQPQQQTPQPQQQTEAAAPSANNARAEQKTADNVAASHPVQSPPQAAKSAEQAEDKTAASRDAIARARDADIKRADAEKRRAERRQRWADRRRFQQPREQELEAVEGSVREVTEPRRIRIREEAEPREMFVAPARGEMPRIRLFDQDD
jgi:outer membrane biosynthesis protein TonB